MNNKSRNLQPTTHNPQPNRGYTLIELMVVVSVMVILVVVAVNLFLTTLVGGGKTNALAEVKQNGDFAITQMEKIVRNGRKLTTNNESQVCETGMTSLGVENNDGGVTIFAAESDRLASSSGQFLTSSTVKVKSDTLVFDCFRSGSGVPDSIKISFTLTKGEAGVDRPEEIVEAGFQTSVTLRNY
jgi:prepilin-type N-terminal cleavage/methylation domain-containing protein